MDLPTFEVAKLDLGPGDVVLVKVDHKLGSEEMASVHRVAKALFPHNRSLVLEPGYSIEVVAKTDLEAA